MWKIDWNLSAKIRSLRKKYLLRMLGIYTAFFVGVLTVFLTLNFNLFYKSFRKEIEASNNRMLEQIQMFTDKYLFNTVFSIINQNFLDPSAGSVAYQFYRDDTLSGDTALSVYQYLKNTSLYYGYIRSICLYNFVNGSAISTDTGLTYDLLSQSSTDLNPYRNVLHTVRTSSDSSLWISPYENQQNGFSSPVILYVRSVPLYAPLSQSDGCIIICIDETALFSQIDRGYSYSGAGELMVVDGTGRLFADSVSDHLYTASVKKSLGNAFNRLTRTGTGFLVQHNKGRQIAINWTQSSESDWKFISVVPANELNQKSLTLWPLMLLLMGTVLVGSLVGLNCITFRLYLPIQSLARRAANTLHLAGDDEYDVSYLNRVFSYFSEKVQEMDATINRNREVIGYKTVIDILYGNFVNTEDIRNKLTMVGRPMECQHFSIVISEINGKIFNLLTSKQREYITLQASDTIAHYFDLRGYGQICIVHPSNCIVSLLNFDGEDAALSGLPELLHMLREEHRVDFNIALSPTLDSLLDISAAYSHMGDYLKYRYIYGYGNIFQPADIERYESGGKNFDAVIQRAETLFQEGEIERLKTLLTDSVHQIRNKGYSYQYAQGMLLQLTCAISCGYRKQGITSADFEQSNLLAAFTRISDIEEYIGWILPILDAYPRYFSVRHTAADAALIDRMCQYVTAHITDLPSLADMSRLYHLSSSHLSRLFKEVRNIGFAEFVQEKKLEKAAEMLVAEPDDISCIAEKLGYTTPAYFSKIFRQKFGVPPALYRKIHISHPT